jgi:anaerobic selenocysteine-containing dehydrogenase
MGDEWQPTICILCSVNCGVEVKLDGRHIARVRGNRAHVASRGYACAKRRSASTTTRTGVIG